MGQLEVLHCIKCPHYNVDESMHEFISDCLLSIFNTDASCPCTKCGYMNDCGDWCIEHCNFRQSIMDLLDGE